MLLPELNTYGVNQKEIQLYWEASPKSTIKQWRIYGAKGLEINFIHPNKGIDLTGGSNPDHAFKQLTTIANRDTPLTPGNCYVKFTRSELGIEDNDPYYFAITSIDNDGFESTLLPSSVHAVPFRDSYFVDEAGEPINVVYKSFEFALSPCATDQWNPERLLDINKILGRPAKSLTMDATGSDYQIRMNSVKNDIITVKSSVPYKVDNIRGSMKIERIYINNSTSTEATVRIYVSG